MPYGWAVYRTQEEDGAKAGVLYAIGSEGANGWERKDQERKKEGCKILSRSEFFSL